MTQDKRLAAMRELVAEIWPEDGTPIEHRDPSRSKRRARQQRRLQGRITRIITESLALADDAEVRAATVCAIDLQSDGRAVRVTLEGIEPHRRAAVAAWLQDQLAQGLSRKRTPSVRVVGGAP